MRNGNLRQCGFTMIELLVTLAILGLLVAIAAPRYFANIDRAKEGALREDLFIMRDALDKFYSDRNRYPETLDELVTQHYLRKLPVDPYTRSAKSWVAIPAPDPAMGMVWDVRSGAPDTASDGTWLKDW